MKMGKMTDQKYKNYINELSERTMMTNKVKLVLSSEEYVELYSQLAERRMQARRVWYDIENILAEVGIFKEVT
jgi:predicted metal-binding transcription factor (methanogenesis marker protein 9)